MKVACVQINGGNDVAANIVKLEERVREAAGKGAQLVALPENAFLMEEPGQGAQRKLYTPQSHPGMEAAAHMARAYHCWLLVGSVALKIDASGKTANRSLLFNDKGEV